MSKIKIIIIIVVIICAAIGTLFFILSKSKTNNFNEAKSSLPGSWKSTDGEIITFTYDDPSHTDDNGTAYNEESNARNLEGRIIITNINYLDEKYYGRMYDEDKNYAEAEMKKPDGLFPEYLLIFKINNRYLYIESLINDTLVLSNDNGTSIKFKKN